MTKHLFAFIFLFVALTGKFQTAEAQISFETFIQEIVSKAREIAEDECRAIRLEISSAGSSANCEDAQLHCVNLITSAYRTNFLKELDSCMVEQGNSDPGVCMSSEFVERERIIATEQVRHEILIECAHAADEEQVQDEPVVVNSATPEKDFRNENQAFVSGKQATGGCDLAGTGLSSTSFWNLIWLVLPMLRFLSKGK